MQMQQTPHTPGPHPLDADSRGSHPSSARFLPKEDIAACASFRDAVCLAWDRRAIRGMTQRTLAELLEVPGSHMSNMLNREAVDRHGKARQDLPARLVHEFERVVGNKAVSQWLNRMARLTVLEEVINERGGL